MVFMDSITEEPITHDSINNKSVNEVGFDEIDDSKLDHHSSPDAGETIRFANDTTNNTILYPFAHQVGGHTQLLTLDKSTLCKPLIPRELLFYLNIPKELIQFVPSYKGVVQIRKTGQGDNHASVVYQPLRSPKSPCDLTNNNIRAGSSRIMPTRVGPRRMTADLCSFPFELSVQLRPFSDEKILRKNLSQDNLLQADFISRPNDKYLLLLENIASKYQLPCILDLKMGPRQHGIDATEEKRHRQIAKCQASTSASLGVRLCGMQVYQVDYGGFLWYDKYYGRKMDEEGLKCALYEYFRNGSQLNQDIIDDVIERLKLLSCAVENSPSFRFYGTSLLIIHEGCKANLNSPVTRKCSVDVRLIDFAHTICDYPPTSTSANLKYFDDINRKNSASSSVLRTCKSAERLTLPTQSDTSSATAIASKDVNTSNKIMIDQNLAQSQISSSEGVSNNQSQHITKNQTIQPTGRSTKFIQGPDRGLLFGLENLMRLLYDLKTTHMRTIKKL